jgi:hypothetical protein
MGNYLFKDMTRFYPCTLEQPGLNKCLFWVEMLSCYTLGWLKWILCNMLNVDHDNFGDIYVCAYG